MFQIDLRSLALLRILTGLAMVGQLCTRFVDFSAFYGDQGLLPANLARELLGSAAFWSLYWLPTDLAGSQFLWGLNVVAAVAVVLGIRTRLSLLTCLVLIWSLQVRNVHVLTAGDVLLRWLLIWMMLLPVNQFWSIDQWLGWCRRSDTIAVRSWSSLGIMLLVASMYLFAGVAKLNEYWFSGTALAYSLQLEIFVSGFGRSLLAWPAGMKLATWLTLVFELVGPFLLFSPWRTHYFRGLLMGLFWLLHVGVWLTMSVGWFSPIAMIAWVIFVPTEVWGRLGLRLTQNRIDAAGWLPRPATGNDWLAMILIAHSLLLNLTAGMSNAPWLVHYRQFSVATMTIQEFRMFAKPPLYSPTFEYRAILNNGQRVDLFTGQTRSPQAPPTRLGYAELGSHVWRRYHGSLIPIPNEPIAPGADPLTDRVRRRLLEYFVDRWNREHQANEQVVQAELNCWIKPLESNAIATPATSRQWAVYPAPQ